MGEKKVWAMTSKSFDGAAIFRFNSEGLLISYDVSEATMSPQQLNWFTQRLPRTHDELIGLLKGVPGIRLAEMPNGVEDVSFDMFWIKYNERVRSSKKRCLKIWPRFNRANRVALYLFIDEYNRSILPGCAKKNAETYLNAEQWNN
jgi:hypothetical protein